MKLKFNRWYVVGVVDMVQFNSTFQRLHLILEFFQKSIFWKPCESAFYIKNSTSHPENNQNQTYTNEQMNETTNVDFIKQLFNFFDTKLNCIVFTRKFISAIYVIQWNDSVFYSIFLFHVFLGCNSIENFYISNFKYQIISWKQTSFSFKFKSSDCIVVSVVLHAFQQIRILFPMPFRLHGIFSITSLTTEIRCRTFGF